MVYVAISFFVVVILYVYTFAALSRRPDTTANGDIYRLQRGFVTTIGLCGVFWIVVTGAFLFVFWGDPAEAGNVWYLLAFVGFILVNLAAYIYVSKSQVVIANGILINRTPPLTTAVPLSDVRKIIIYTATSVSAKMTRLYGKKTVTLEGLLSGYDDLVEKVVASCPNAEIIRKPRSNWHGLKPRYQGLLTCTLFLFFFLLVVPVSLYVALRLARIFKIRMDVPVISQDNGWVWTGCVIAVFLGLLVLSGWVERLAIGLSLYATGQIRLREISALVFRCRYPSHWCTHNGDTKRVT
jgi:hypothetical protein